MRLGAYWKASSNTTHGRLDTQSLTVGTAIKSLQRRMRTLWSPSNSSSPSMKRHIFVLLFKFFAASRSICCSSWSVQSMASSLNRQSASHLFGDTTGIKSGACSNIWARSERNSPACVICNVTPEFQKKKIGTISLQPLAHSLKNFVQSFGEVEACVSFDALISVRQMYFIKVDFPDPAFPVIQYSCDSDFSQSLKFDHFFCSAEQSSNIHWK